LAIQGSGCVYLWLSPLVDTEAATATRAEGMEDIYMDMRIDIGDGHAPLLAAYVNIETGDRR
jgi:hypothetical protein